MIRAATVSSPPAHIDPSHLPSLVRRAADQLASATSAAEVLEARDSASVVYDAAKKAARMAKAKGAHDTLIAASHRVQADALEIEAMAKRRLADEYDDAVERGEIAGRGKPVNLPDGNVLPTASEIGLTHKDIHEARTIRDAENVEPGIVRRALDEKLDAGQEPTKAALREAIQKVRDETRENLSQTIKDMEAAKQQAIAERKARKDAPTLYNGLSADDRVAEMEEAVRVLEAEADVLRAENKLYGEMRIQFEQGGFDKVIADKDEEIRVLKTRVFRESEDKAGWARSAKFWKEKALELGWSNDEVISLDEPAEAQF